MRLIDAPIGIFRFDGELVLKTEYYSENKRSGKYIPDCYIVRSGEYFWGGAKTANELINLDVEPVDFAELLPTVTDTISRQAAIEKILGQPPEPHYPSWYAEQIKELPPAQPEIIRCKDCKHWVPGYITDNDDFIPTKCGEWQQMVGHSSDDYCSLAERREVTE